MTKETHAGLPVPARDKYLNPLEDAGSYLRFAKDKVLKHDYNYPHEDSSDFGISAGPA
ncbi:hypothetical protein J1605_003689 [Eschrichtius robustus]|uniref:Uncharacterized protein n=1 Tax=Eschrichtius robustus TaxID=9764 RepID=A0AB34HR92_ESCRO|nr:hypothetical protein J1605_003689 [Eschrichtius robustus]